MREREGRSGANLRMGAVGPSIVRPRHRWPVKRRIPLCGVREREGGGGGTGGIIMRTPNKITQTSTVDLYMGKKSTVDVMGRIV